MVCLNEEVIQFFMCDGSILFPLITYDGAERGVELEHQRDRQPGSKIEQLGCVESCRRVVDPLPFLLTSALRNRLVASTVQAYSIVFASSAGPVAG